MDKQTTLAFLLIGALLIVWMFFNSPDPSKQPQKNKKDSTLVKSDTAKIQSRNNAANNEQLSKSNAPSDTTALGKVFAQGNSEDVITIENNVARFELTGNGARIRKVYLKQYKTWYAKDQKDFFYNHVQLVNTNKQGGDYSIIFLSKDGKLRNTANAAFKANLDKNNYILSGNDSLVLNYTLQVDQNSSIEKSFVFKADDYSVKSNIILNNMEKYISNYTYDVVWETGINFVERNSADEANSADASVYSGGEQTVVNSTGNKETKDFNGKIDWIGVRNKYFAVIIAPLDSASNEGASIEGTHVKVGIDGAREYYSLTLKVPFNNTKYQKNSFRLYTGPIEYNVLKSYNEKFEKIVDFGNLFGLRFLIRPISEYVLLPLFILLHKFISNYGLVIIVFSLIIKVALHPLTRSSLKSMRKMQLLQPKINEIREKFKDDPTRMNKETMSLYSTYGINPAGGCLPVLLQMPILVALFSLFNTSIELRQQPFAFWIHNLSAPDVIYSLDFKIPFFGISQISGLALLLGITMFIQQKMSVKDPNQKAMIYMMPVLFTLMFMGFPSGLNLYYFMFNLFSIVQQYYVNHSHKEVELVPVNKPKKSGGFMAKVLDAAEKQQQIQKQQAAKKKK
jgi:YidC/Oxa1 family membrane protein insertase